MRVSLGQAYVFLLLAIQTASQVTHMVTVGVQGSFFVPPTTSARQGDTILFVFGGAAHTVTQSSFESPCTRLQGGFDSGILGRGIDLSGQAPVWSLTVTNDSEPIWFFCELSMPSSHCETGMVGVINPPSVSLFDQFTNSAKAVTSTPTVGPTVNPHFRSI
ncbi:hypothetical protein C8F01DRAFT_303474 [Mycena amicta]|nr:hypothetical protein C8F01DRAFT_303474 [Mycena amicta]